MKCSEDVCAWAKDTTVTDFDLMQMDNTKHKIKYWLTFPFKASLTRCLNISFYFKSLTIKNRLLP